MWCPVNIISFTQTRRTSLLWCAMIQVTAILTATVTAQRQTSPNEYRNVDYGYAVRIPAGLTIQTNEAPMPNHGFAIRLSPTTRAWADASYAEAATTLAEAFAEQRRSAPDGCHEKAHKSTRMNRLPAIELVLNCEPGSSRVVATTITEVTSFRGTIIYVIGLERPLNDTSAESEAVFKRLVGGFRLIRRQ